jgi:hypothetical protein
MTKPECPLQDQFQALGRAEQGRGRGVNQFTQCKSIILFHGSCARGSRLHGTGSLLICWSSSSKTSSWVPLDTAYAGAFQNEKPNVLCVSPSSSRVEDEGSAFCQNIGEHQISNSASRTRRCESAASGTSHLLMKIVISGADDIPNADHWLLCVTALLWKHNAFPHFTRKTRLLGAAHGRMKTGS